MIISGERRYRAAREVGLRELPCIEMEVDDQAVAEIALIENLQRKDLTAFEEADGLFMLIERFGYTHDEVAQKIGKSRSSVTEALAIAGMPSDVRDQCRRADISSKSLLLQVVRQPGGEAMRNFVKRIVERGMTRDEAREARRKKHTRAQPFIYRFQAPGREYALELRFRRSEVGREEIARALAEVLNQLQAPEGPLEL
jgi:ParB family chromosome partitioning protein